MASQSRPSRAASSSTSRKKAVEEDNSDVEFDDEATSKAKLKPKPIAIKKEKPDPIKRKATEPPAEPPAAKRSAYVFVPYIFFLMLTFPISSQASRASTATNLPAPEGTMAPPPVPKNRAEVVLKTRAARSNSTTKGKGRASSVGLSFYFLFLSFLN